MPVLGPSTTPTSGADTQTGTWLSLAEVKTHLNYLQSEVKDDAEIIGYVQAACAWVDGEVGPVLPTQLTRIIRGATDVLSLPIVPVLSVDALTEASPAQNAGITVNVANVTFDATSGTVRKLYGNWFYDDDPNPVAIIWQNPVTVTWTAGRAAVPPVLRLAALRLVAHWWESTQQAGGGGGNPFGSGDDGASGTSGPFYGIPYAVQSLLEPFRLPRRSFRSVPLV